jgi:hypothetical protein
MFVGNLNGKKMSFKVNVRCVLEKQGVKLCAAFFVGFCELGNEPSGYIEGVNVSDHQHNNNS